jgi:hypothetical protein
MKAAAKSKMLTYAAIAIVATSSAAALIFLSTKRADRSERIPQTSPAQEETASPAIKPFE